MEVTILGAHNCETQDSRFVSLLIDDILPIDASEIKAVARDLNHPITLAEERLQLRS